MGRFRLVDFAPIGFCRLVRHLAESEDAGFEGVGAIESPVALGDGLDELLFESADGSLAVFFEGFVLFGAEGIELAGEAVFVGVEAGALLPGIGLGPEGPANSGENQPSGGR